MEYKDLEKILNKWFEMKVKTYDRLEHDDSIYYYYDGQKFADIRIDKKYKFIDYQLKFYEEFSEIIPIQKNVFQGFMSKWVEDTFGLKGFTPSKAAHFQQSFLKIPLV